MQEGIQLPELLLKIKALREARHVAFNFMKRRVQPLMARDTLDYQYIGEDDSSWMPGGEIEHHRETRQDLQGHAGAHALPSPQVLHSSSAERGQ
jgi:hypothetical protein